MIRGAIEIGQPKRVAGWIVCSAGPLRGKTILAFSGSRCVGAGSVSVFRPDLVGSELGDGFSGFDFPIELNDDEAVGSVVVRLELSDAALIQSTSEVVARSEVGSRNAAAPAVPASAAMPTTAGQTVRPDADRRAMALPIARRA